MKAATTILMIALALFALAIGIVLVREGADLLARFACFVGDLLHAAKHRFNSYDGITSAILLVAICVFPAWAYGQFRRSRKGRKYQH